MEIPYDGNDRLTQLRDQCNRRIQVRRVPPNQSTSGMVHIYVKYNETMNFKFGLKFTVYAGADLQKNLSSGEK